MFKNAINEIRLHPGRIVATLVAIAISIGFMAGAVTFIATMRDATAKGQNLALSRADIVIDGDYANPTEALAAIRAQVGVAAAEFSPQQFGLLSRGDASALTTAHRVFSGELAWASVAQGRWPGAVGEIALSPSAAQQLGATTGDRVTGDEGTPPLLVVGITNEPQTPMAFSVNVYLADAAFGPVQSGRWITTLVKAAPDADLSSLQTRLATLVKPLSPDSKTQTAAEVRQQAINELTGQFDVMKNMLLAFAAISLLVGMIIIANTFNILVAQRRQQIGLLRAIGASGAQVRRKFFAEALVAGIIGSACGVLLGLGAAAIGAWWLKSLSWGLTLPATDLLAAFGVGVIATVVAALLPSIRATRVSPMEALQTVPTEQRAKRITRVRYVVCGFFALGGVVLTYLALTATENNVLPALGAGFAFTIAVLGAAPIYVPWLIAGLGRVFSFAGPTVRLAAANGTRNPQRAAATATALMLAMGLIVTLQVGISTMRTTTIEGINNRYPLDLTLTATSDTPIKASVIEQARAVPGVKQVAAVSGGQLVARLGIDDVWQRAIAPGQAMVEIAPQARQPAPSDTQAYVDPARYPKNYDKSPVTITGTAGNVSLTLVPSRFAEGTTIVVSEATLKKLVAEPAVTQLWLDLGDRQQLVPAIKALTTIAQNNGLQLDGSAPKAYMVEQIVTIMLVVLSALLGVAVLIALVGVANTLGLSVLERKRESALLRALGMQKASLRRMLLIEALLIAGVGAAVGIAAGAFFGWLGTTSVYKMVPSQAGQPLVYSIDPLWTGGLLLVAVVAAALASVLPGRRAANATPTEALADE